MAVMWLGFPLCADDLGSSPLVICYVDVCFCLNPPRGGLQVVGVLRGASGEGCVHLGVNRKQNV